MGAIDEEHLARPGSLVHGWRSDHTCDSRADVGIVTAPRWRKDGADGKRAHLRFRERGLRGRRCLRDRPRRDQDRPTAVAAFNKLGSKAHFILTPIGTEVFVLYRACMREGLRTAFLGFFRGRTRSPLHGVSRVRVQRGRTGARSLPAGAVTPGTTVRASQRIRKRLKCRPTLRFIPESPAPALRGGGLGHPHRWSHGTETAEQGRPLHRD